MVEGTLYRYDEPNQTIEIAEVDILGHITSVVDSSRIPEKDGKSNCNFPGAPYARWSDEEHPDAVVVYINDVWTIFTAWDPEADWESFRAQREQD